MKKLLIVFPLVCATLLGCSSSKGTSVSSGDDYQYDYDVKIKDDRFGQNNTAKADSFMFAVSYAPDFCQYQKSKADKDKKPLPIQFRRQCVPVNKYGWVIHGLWPQNSKAKEVKEHPRFCKGDLPKVDENILKKYLAKSPGKQLLQAEWEKHGSCAFEKAEDYFKKQEELFDSLKLPKGLPSEKELKAYIQQHNPQFKGKNMIKSHGEIRLCYSLDYKAIDCPTKAKK